MAADQGRLVEHDAARAPAEKGRNMIRRKGASLVVVASAALAMLTGCTPHFVKLGGTVTDAASGKPIPKATVSDGRYGLQPPRSAITDSEGKYSYTTWAEEHNIVVAAPGYKPQVENLNPGGQEKEISLDFKLTPE